MPVLALGAAYIPVLGGNITMPTIIHGMQQLTENVQGIKVPNSGHFIPEEQPEFVIDQLFKFFGNSNNGTD
jgi:pimeloyl-ACP methyl ester carboxylesterase